MGSQEKTNFTTNPNEGRALFEEILKEFDKLSFSLEEYSKIFEAKYSKEGFSGTSLLQRYGEPKIDDNGKRIFFTDPNKIDDRARMEHMLGILKTISNAKYDHGEFIRLLKKEGEELMDFADKKGSLLKRLVA